MQAYLLSLMMLSGAMGSFAREGPLCRRIVIARCFIVVNNTSVDHGGAGKFSIDRGGNCTAFHVNGPLYVDERIASFDDTSDKFTYYLLNRNFSVIGTGDSTGTSIEQLDYSSTGELAGAATICA